MPARPRRLVCVSILLLAPTALALCAGCSAPNKIRSRDRYPNGVVYVLPGIEGRSVFNRAVAVGLDEGGVPAAIEVYDWTTGIPGLYLANLTLQERNRKQAERLARRIVTFKRRYSKAPVHLIGHSGGGGIVIMTLEHLPRDVQVDSAILLAPALSPDYNLTRALRQTRYGICNFYSALDFGFLGVGTTVFGSIDRDRGPSAGAVGFRPPDGLDPQSRDFYDRKLRQVRWTGRLRRYGASGTHMGWTSRGFARDYLAPLLLSQTTGRQLPDDFFD